jgi:hypothetical protein
MALFTKSLCNFVSLAFTFCLKTGKAVRLINLIQLLQLSIMPSYITSIAAFCLLLVRVQGQLILAGGRGKVKLELYQADRTTLIGPMVNDMVIDLAKTPKVNIKGSGKSSFQNRRFSSMSFFIDGKLVRTDNTIPSWMLDDAWIPTVGMHTIKAVGYRRNNGKGTKMLESSVRVNVIDTRTKAPTKAPVKALAPSPVAAPIAAPVVSPATPVATPLAAPIMAPVAAPMVAPMVAPPMVAPVVAPVIAPVIAPVVATTKLPVARTKAPTKAPSNRPTKAPTRRPTPAPTAAPTPCVSDIVKYINYITLSNQTLSVNGTTPLDQAVRQLLSSNTRQGVRLSTCNVTDRERLRQRYAYFSLVYSTGVAGAMDFNHNNECDWQGLACNVYGTVTELKFGRQNLKGSIPVDVGLWNDLKSVSFFDNGLTGSLPTSIGFWTNVKSVDVGDNKLNGTLPASIGAWTVLEELKIYGNVFSGKLPSSIGVWTNLQYLDMAENKLTGLLSASIVREWANITYIDIASNGFTGSLPAVIGAWTKLDSFFVNKNQFNATVPAELANWVSIRKVNLSFNSFNGSIPKIGTNFCPKNFSDGVNLSLSADCRKSTVICECCNICCDGTICVFA